MHFKSIEPQAETQLRKFENVANLRFKAQNYRVEIREITPDQARKWLEFNEGNRKVKRSSVRFLKNQLSAGKWKLTGETICFDASGRLVDGQHRLIAITETGISAVSMIVWGIPAESQSVMDTGTNRAFVDVISMAYPDAVDPSGVGSACKFVMSFHNGRFGIGIDGGHKDHKPDNTDVLNFLDANPDFFEFYNYSRKHYLGGDRVVTKNVFIGMWWILSEYGAKASDDFFTKLSTGLGVTATDPIHVFRSILIREKTSSDASKYTSSQRLRGLVHAWNKYVLGERVKTFRIPKDMPEILSA